MDFPINDKDEIDFNTQSVISFFCGNPIVELTRGEIHLLQPAAQTTNLKKSKIVATLAGMHTITLFFLLVVHPCSPFLYEHLRILFIYWGLCSYYETCSCFEVCLPKLRSNINIIYINLNVSC